jgi:hypothetical protein
MLQDLEPEGREFESLWAHHFTRVSFDNLNGGPFSATPVLPQDSAQPIQTCTAPNLGN